MMGRRRSKWRDIVASLDHDWSAILDPARVHPDFLAIPPAEPEQDAEIIPWPGRTSEGEE